MVKGQARARSAPLTYHVGTAEVILDRRAPASERRRGTVAQGLRELCVAAGLAYLSPHKLRHGHAVYALRRARTIGELKAVSQNLMHADLAVTDGVYGAPTDDDLQHTIARLGQAPTLQGDQDSLIAKMEALLAQLKHSTA
jgi:integrase